MGTYLGIAAANIVNTLNPEMIVIGGGVSAAFDLFAQTAREEMARRAFPVPARAAELCEPNVEMMRACWARLGWRLECGDLAPLCFFVFESHI